MDLAMQRMVNDAFRVLRKRVALFAKRQAANAADAEDLAADACERAVRYFRGLTEGIELSADNLDHFMQRTHRRAIVAVQGARINAYRRSQVAQRWREAHPPALAAGSWVGGGYHAPAPDQRLIVRQTMAAVERNSTTPGQRHLSLALRRHVEEDELDVTPIELAREANETPNTRSAWARKLRTKTLA